MLTSPVAAHAAASQSGPPDEVHDSTPAFAYGAVYFRKSNPPEEDWARDFQTAARTGMNMFRHWVMWSAVEVAPGKYDWRDYNRMMELAAQNGIRTVLAEMITAAPEWMFKMYSEARFEAQDGFKGSPGYSGSSATGGFPGMCLDNSEVRGHAEAFLKALAGRYGQHSALYGYELWKRGESKRGRQLLYANGLQRLYSERTPRHGLRTNLLLLPGNHGGVP
jgi:beta-galactosidase